MAYLEAKNLSKSFKGTAVLSSVSLSVEKGESLVIIGDSGSGKTTLLRILCFLETPDAGEIALKGQSLYSAPEKLTSEEKANKRSHFGLVFQGFGLFPQHNVLENVLLPLRLKRKKALKASLSSLPFFQRTKAFRSEWKKSQTIDEKKAKDLLEEFHLSSKEKDYPYSLSGGEAQRVALARALALEPEILCFDEPTSALDPRLKNQVASLLLDLKKKGHTLIVVTHEIAFAQAVGDRIVFLEDGMIKEEGNRSILLSPKSEELRAFLSESQKEENDERGSEDQETRAHGAL
jgi:polar amino acid transport system ATP-binding protein